MTHHNLLQPGVDLSMALVETLLLCVVHVQLLVRLLGLLFGLLCLLAKAGQLFPKGDLFCSGRLEVLNSLCWSSDTVAHRIIAAGPEHHTSTASKQHHHLLPSLALCVHLRHQPLLCRSACCCCRLLAQGCFMLGRAVLVVGVLLPQLLQLFLQGTEYSTAAIGTVQ